MKVKLDDIRLDGGTQCRVVIDQATIYNYLEHMKDGDEFPAVETVFDGTTHWLTDGFHRWHAMKLIGVKETEVRHKQGTAQDAILEALKANSRHGKTLTNDDKRNKVRMALLAVENATDAEIARLCGLSKPFVASVRRPETKLRQEEARQKWIESKAARKERNQITEPPEIASGAMPDEEELRSVQMAEAANMEAMAKIVEADEPLREAYEEIQRLNMLHAQLELRMKGLMNERNEAIKQAKYLQKELDKLKGKK